jgi:hypothetical protein
VQTQTVLHLALAQIVQARLPVPILGQIIGHMLGQKNMPGIAAIQHPLRDVDSRSCKVRFVVNVPDRIDWTAVNSHSHLDVRILLQHLANLERTARGLFRTVKKKERHSIAGRHSNELAPGFRSAKAFRSAHDLIQLLEQFNLLVHKQF